MAILFTLLVEVLENVVRSALGLHLILSLFSIPRSFLLITLLMSLISFVKTTLSSIHSAYLNSYFWPLSRKHVSFADILSYILGPLAGISNESACPNVGIFCCTNMEIPDAQ